MLTSNAWRHRYFVQSAARTFDISDVLCQPKTGGAPKDGSVSPLIAQHFQSLAEAERQEFANRLHNVISFREVAEINDPGLVRGIAAKKPSVILLFGTRILKGEWLEAFPNRIVNLHLGLSPFYRGAATLFWPAANGELECIGATIHLAVKMVDAGSMLARIKARPKVGDTYYSLTNRLIREAIDATPQAATDYLNGKVPEVQQPQSSRAYRRSDFNEAALRQTLKFFGSGLTQEQIDTATRSGRCVC